MEEIQGASSASCRFNRYDVVFSFLKTDQGIALRIDALLQGRLKTAFPSSEEEWVPGSGSEERVKRLFGFQSRIVTVLYRRNWGKSGSSLMEERAIRRRAQEEGYDFVLFIPLDASCPLPEWLPRKQIWPGFSRWGAEGTAAVIEARVQQAGGIVRGESPPERAQRIEHDRALNEARRKFLNSQEGVQSALYEVSKLFGEIERISKEITAQTPSLAIRADRDSERLILSTHGFSLDAAWFSRSLGALEESPLHVTLWRGPLSVQGVTFEKPRRLAKREFRFDRTLAGETGWVDSKGEDRFLSSAEVGEECIHLLLDRISENRNAI